MSTIPTSVPTLAEFGEGFNRGSKGYQTKTDNQRYPSLTHCTHNKCCYGDPHDGEQESHDVELLARSAYDSPHPLIPTMLTRWNHMVEEPRDRCFNVRVIEGYDLPQIPCI